MKPLEQLISELRSKGISVRVDGNELAIRAPKGTMTAQLTAQLRENKSALIDYLRAAQTQHQAPAKVSLSTQDNRDQLSDSQRRIWFLNRLEGPSATYNMPLAVRLRGMIDAARIEQTFKQIAQRHETLRTRFVSEGDLVKAVIDTEPLVQLVIETADQQQSIETQIATAVGKSSQVLFDMANEHLVKAWLVKLSDESHLLLVTLHHIVADGWSLANLIEEFKLIYANQSARVPALAVQYADYVAWQSKQLGQSDLDIDLQWWRDQLSGAPDLIALPLDRARPPIMRYRGKCLKSVLNPNLMTAVQQCAKSHDVTPYMVMLGAFAVLLQRYAGTQECSDLVIGTTSANRPHPELEPLIGLFINMLALRLRVDAGTSGVALLGLVKQVYLQANAHQNIAFERIVEAINPRRSLSHAPLFQVTFDVQNTPQSDLVLNGVSLDPIEPTVTASKFDLSLSIEDDSTGSFARWTWNPDIFDDETISQLDTQFCEILQGLTLHTDWMIGRLPVMSSQQSVALAATQRMTDRDLPCSSWLTEFERQVSERSQALAVSFGQTSLTYRELHSRAIELALTLQGLGIGVEDKVAVVMERGIDLVTSLLAVQYAGAAYIPLDPAYPPERLTWVFEDAQPRAVLTQCSLLSKFSGLTSATVLALDDPSRPRQSPSAQPNLTLPAAQTLAYVIFTSGSTGRPKGVQIEHLALANFLRSMATRPGLNHEDVLLGVTTISFDIAALEFYLPLAVGAHLVIADRDSAMNGQALQRLLREHQITCMQATPSTWRLLLDSGWQDADQLSVLCGGEALPKDLTGRLQAVGATVWNVYGPTETTIWSAARKIEDVRAADASGNEPIGGGIDNTQLYVLDEFGSLLPPGMPGELWIGGLGLARGYLHRPGLTAERYRPDPYSPTPGARIYGTGDLVCENRDGTYEFLGRLDGQIKLRGYRIELGEIESALRRQPGVSQAVVMAVGDDAVDRQLVAYLENGNEQSVSPDALRNALRAVLPIYMVPTQFISIAKLPLTPNGKIDRKSLPKPAITANDQDLTKISPRNSTEKRIGAIWCTALKRGSIDIDVNFFDAGGHSLLLAQVHHQLEQEFGQPIELVTLFQHPTIRSLAKNIDAINPSSGSFPVAREQGVSTTRDEPIAIIGMACRLPGAPDLESFWVSLLEGNSNIRFFNKNELRSAGISAIDFDAANYVPAHGAIDDIECFDASFFGYRPAQARLIDPQQRLFLETAWHTLENAGYANTELNPSIGVFAGCGQNDYLIDNVLPNLQDGDGISAYEAILGGEKDFIATRVSYTLNLTGPSINIQTACSTSLVAVHMACQSLRAGECAMALAGGVALRVPQANGHHFQEGMITSPDGHCRPFDQRAHGTVWGSGTAAVLLKPLQQAIDDADTIYAVIRGSAINNDGANKVGFTAPSLDGQASVIRQAQEVAGVKPQDIGFVETHGTATALGDLIETSALKKVWGEAPSHACALGAIKSQIGHLNSAAGIAGLIKAALSVQRGKIPANSYFEQANPALNLDQSPFYINRDAINWPAHHQTRVAGVSSFGIGGTNAHVVLSEAAPKTASTESGQSQLLVLSAHTEPALKNLRERFLQELANHPKDLRDIAATLVYGRKPMAHRMAVVAESCQEAISQLGQAKPRYRTEQPTIAWLFSGQGSQSVAMGQSLYARWAVFRDTVNDCATLLEPLINADLRELFDDNLSANSKLANHIDETWLTQPALFVFEYAQARLWQSWGLAPTALLGHSLGEYVAACLAGVFELNTALHLVAARGMLIWQEERGAMLAVGLAPDDLAPFLTGSIGEKLDLAAVNGPRACVVAGPSTAIQEMEALLKQHGHPCKQLNTSHAFHSRMLDGAKQKYLSEVASAKLAAPNIPVVSNVTGTWLTEQQAIDPAYWADHITATVRFADGITTLLSEQNCLLLEIGPGQVLTNLARQQGRSGTVVIASGDSDASMLTAVGNLWCELALLDMTACLASEDSKVRRISLPLYPFERQRHWLDSKTNPIKKPAGRLSTEDWFMLPHWTQAARLSDPSHVSDRIWYLDRLKGSWLSGVEHQLALSGEPFEHLAADTRDEMEQCIERFAQAQTSCLVICADENSGYSNLHRVLAWASAWQRLRTGQALQMAILTAPIHPILGTETLAMSQVGLHAAALVIAQEFPSIRVRCIDVARETDDRLLHSVWMELSSDQSPSQIGLRGARRFVPSYSPVKLPQNVTNNGLRTNGVYLITGGLGNMGLAIARGLIERLNATVILTARPKASPASQTSNNKLSALGPKAIAKHVDVTDEAGMAALIEWITKTYGQLNGVFHAAGSPGRWCSIEDFEKDCDDNLLHTKLAGAQVLARVLESSHADFCVLMSSVASELGGLGYVQYAAANVALDAFAHQMTLTSRLNWLSIGWDAWKFDETGDNDWIEETEGVDALFRIIAAMPCPRVIVSTTPWQARVDRWANRTNTDHPPSILDSSGTAINSVDMTSTEAAIAAIWQSTLGYESIGLDDDYFELGGDSMLAIRVVEMLQSHFKRNMPITSVLQYSTIRKMADLIDGRDTMEDALLVRLNSCDSDTSVFMIPGTGGSVIYLSDLARELGKLGCSCIGLQASGLDGQTTPQDSIEAIARENIAALLEHQPSGPYTLVGHSLGSWIAFEMARQLNTQGQDAAKVIVLDTAAPGPRANDRMRNWTDQQWLTSVAQNVGQVWNKSFDFSGEPLKDKNWDEQIAWLHRESIAMGILPSGSDLRLVKGLVQVFRTQSLIQYAPPQKAECQVVLLRAREPLADFLEGIPAELLHDQTWGWRRFALGSVAVEFVQGNHLNMVSGERAANLAACIRAHLNTHIEVTS